MLEVLYGYYILTHSDDASHSLRSREESDLKLDLRSSLKGGVDGAVDEIESKSNGEMHDSATIGYEYEADIGWCADRVEDYHDYLAGYLYDATKKSIGTTRALCLVFCSMLVISVTFTDSLLYNSTLAIITQLLYSSLIICKNYFVIRGPIKLCSEASSITSPGGYHLSWYSCIPYHSDEYLNKSSLPTYSILLPLLREANIVRQLIYNIKAAVL